MTQVADSDIFRSQSQLSTCRSPDLPSLTGMGVTKFSQVPNATALEVTDRLLEPQPLNCRQDDFAEIQANAFDDCDTNHLGFNEELLTGLSNIGAIGLGDMEDFFDLRSWL
jgi:hypothetical protein